jgi:hypothetical protein
MAGTEGEGRSDRTAVRSVASTSPCDSQSYDAPRVRFSATVGEEPEIEVALV